MIQFIVGLFLGAVFGFIGCAVLSDMNDRR